MSDVARARRGLAIYFTVLIIGSGLLQWRIIRGGSLDGSGGLLVFALMWVPTLASVVARVALREGAGDVSFRLGGRIGRQSLLFAWLFPIFVGLVAYGIAWGLGIARFDPKPVDSFPSATDPIARFGLTLAMALTVGQLISALAAFGEEVGWRGYMLTRLIRAGVPFPLVTSGAIWGAWHVPLILSGLYATGQNRLLSAGLFMLSVTAAGVLIGWLRLRSGSVWPAVLAHGSWNVIIQGVFDRSTSGAEPGGPAALWIGESGLLVVAAVVLSAIVIIRMSPLPRQVPEPQMGGLRQIQT